MSTLIGSFITDAALHTDVTSCRRLAATAAAVEIIAYQQTRPYACVTFDVQ